MSEYIIKSRLPSYQVPNISVGEYLNSKLNQIIAKDVNKIALIDYQTGHKLTHLEYSQKAKKLAQSLIENAGGIQSTDFALFFSDNNLPYFVLLLSMAYLGLPVSPNKPSNGAYETVQQLRDCGATILVISKAKLSVIEQILNDQNTAHVITQLRMIILLDTTETTIETFPGKIISYQQLDSYDSGALEKIPYFPVKNPKTDPFTVVYTSGSTGLPKGAILSHHSYIASIEGSLRADCFRKYKGEITGFAAPLGHISGTYFSVVFLMVEMQLIIIDSLLPAVVYDAVRKYSVTYLLIAAIHGIDMIQNDGEKYDFSSLKALITSGGKFPENIAKKLIEKYHVEMNEIYGTTEFMGSVAHNSGKWESGNLGTPLPNNEVKIVDLVTGKALGPNEQGEICFRGPGLFVGYLNNEEATRATIDPDGWYHSGDVGHVDERGNLFLTDRLKELIKYKAWSIAPAEIEALLGTHPRIVESCVVGVRHASEGAHLRAYVRVKGGHSTTVSKEEIIKYVEDNMGYMKRLNGGVVFVPAIRRISVGKIDRKYYNQLVKDELLIELAK